MIPRFALPIFLALTLCTAQFANAGVKPRATPVHHHVVIESVSADSITIDQPGGSKTFKITKFTEITFKGDTVTADKLEAGMRVQVTPDAADADTAGQIKANDAPKEPVATPAPKK
jgi:hypothetical protein